MVLRRTDTIGALLPDLHGEFFSELIRGIDAAARSRGLHLLPSSSHGNADETAAAIRAMNGRGTACWSCRRMWTPTSWPRTCRPACRQC